MSFSDLLADLDKCVFAELADDTAATWQPAGGEPFTVAVILEAGQRLTVVGQMPQVGEGELARVSVAELALKAGELKPGDGDTLLVNGVLFTIHGQPWLDDGVNGRDWLCPVTR